MSTKINLLVIDGQNCFMGEDDGRPLTVRIVEGGVERVETAPLPVPGARSDMQRVGTMIGRLNERLRKIFASFDKHQRTHVAHPVIWRGQDGKPIPIHTDVSFQDFLQGRWNLRHESLRAPAFEYLRSLEEKGLKLHIWPVHGVPGTWDHCFQDDLRRAFDEWSDATCREIRYVGKGGNRWREHFGIFETDVPDPNDPGSRFDDELLEDIFDADVVVTAGETTPVCVKSTFMQMIPRLTHRQIRKIHILTDGMSSIGAVPGTDYPAITERFFKEMKSLDMTLTTSTEFYA